MLWGYPRGEPASGRVTLQGSASPTRAHPPASADTAARLRPPRRSAQRGRCPRRRPEDHPRGPAAPPPLPLRRPAPGTKRLLLGPASLPGSRRCANRARGDLCAGARPSEPEASTEAGKGRDVRGSGAGRAGALGGGARAKTLPQITSLFHSTNLRALSGLLEPTTVNSAQPKPTLIAPFKTRRPAAFENLRISYSNTD